MARTAPFMKSRLRFPQFPGYAKARVKQTGNLRRKEGAGGRNFVNVAGLKSLLKVTRVDRVSQDLRNHQKRCITGARH